jgi:hypothetical protein
MDIDSRWPNGGVKGKTPLRNESSTACGTVLVVDDQTVFARQTAEVLARADLNAAQWTRGIHLPVDAVVTNQALHDLGSDEAVAATYRCVHALLPETGVLVNAELVIPADGSKPSKPGKLTVAAHLERLREAGFRDVHCDVDHGEYACLVARK